MKKYLVVVLIALFTGAVALHSQDFVAPAPEEVPLPESPVEQRPAGLQGIITQFFRTFQPLQLINPFAPSYYGSGEQNVSPKADPNEPPPPYYESKGLVLFGVER